MEGLIRLIFEAFPDKSLIINGKCSDCKRLVTIDIVPTSQGFGLLGGAFVECSADKYVIKCPDCYKADTRMIKPYQVIPKSSSIIDKKIGKPCVTDTQTDIVTREKIRTVKARTSDEKIYI